MEIMLFLSVQANLDAIKAQSPVKLQAKKGE